jgi:hypothetical protein
MKNREYAGDARSGVNKLPMKIFTIVLILGLMGIAAAQTIGVPARSTIGVGTRAFAMGNSYVALSDDASAMFWNPAGLAFTPVREVIVGLSGFFNGIETEFQQENVTSPNSSVRPRVRPNLIALLRAIPTTRGGFSMAFGFQNPYISDDILKYNYQIAGDWDTSNYRAFGQFNLWTAAFGLQVAPDFGVGAAVSLLTGRNTLRRASNKLYYEEKIIQSYLGADLRAGILYSMFDRLKLGLRIELPQFIIFDEEYTVEITSDSTVEEPNNGRLKTGTAGAIGISYRFPFILVSAEVRARTPIPDAEDESMYSFWKVGAGAGVEVPLFVQSVFLRAGYSWQELDHYPLLIEYDTPPPGFETDALLDVKKNEHLITAGLAFMTKHGLSFDLSYGFKFWEINSYAPVGGVVNEVHKSHYFLSSFAVRY